MIKNNILKGPSYLGCNNDNLIIELDSMDKEVKINIESWNKRSLDYQTNINGVLYKSFPESLNIHVHNTHIRFLHNNIFEISGKRFLDIGCGYGRISSELIKSYPEIDIMGLDISSVYVDLYKENTLRKAQLGSLEDIPVELGKFDYIICIAVFMYVQKTNLKSVFNNLLDHLNENGKIILIEPLRSGKVFQTGFGLMNLFKKNSKQLGGSFGYSQLKQLIKDCGGRIIVKNRVPFTTICIIIIYLITKIFKKVRFRRFFNLISKIDNFLGNFRLPSLHIALVVFKDSGKKI